MSEKDDLLKALELDKAGDWDGSHKVVQAIDSTMAERIHAYLHRVEGDLSNARYWYNRAGVTPETCSLQEEWDKLANELKGT